MGADDSNRYGDWSGAVCVTPGSHAGTPVAEEVAYRRPHYDPYLAALGGVMPNAVEEQANRRGQMYARSTLGARIPPVEVFWVEGLRTIAGATRTMRGALPVPIVVLVGRTFEDTFCTVVHELRHVADVWVGGFTAAEMEVRAQAAVEQARRERWRW
jgi:hypothetical protein